MLEKEMLERLKEIFSPIQSKYNLVANYTNDNWGKQLKEFVQEVASTNDNISFELIESDKLILTIQKNGKDSGIRFKGVPGGHEFTSFILAILNAEGLGKNLPDELLQKRIKALKGKIQLKTYASLSCTNCPEVVQSLNIMALLNENIEHEMVDGAIYKDEIEKHNISAVPTVYANGEELHIGASTLGNLLIKLEEKIGKEEIDLSSNEAKEFELVVVGGGPAGTAAAIYYARKGLKVAIIAERIGGQVNETVGIENIPSVAHTTGQTLAADLKKHIDEYNITILDQRMVEKVEEDGDNFILLTNMQEKIVTQQIILATGAKWRKLNVEGEEQYTGKGVAFCPHCDGPFFKGKDVAVVGGGNSGIEAAIDLAGICSSVTVLEFMPELKADKVLQEKLYSLDNVKVMKNVASKEVLGDNSKVIGLKLEDRSCGKLSDVKLDGIFVQIGLTPNTENFAALVERNKMGEIIIDERGRTSHKNIYAAGDCTTVPYKQIVIAMGEGAKAALTAFDERIRG